MSNILQTSATWLAGKLKSHAGQSVTIRQGTTTLTGLTATLSMVEHEVVDSEGFATKVMAADWTFTASDLGDLQLRAGSQITDTESGDKYEVTPLGKKPAVERLDALGILTTVHTKKVA